MDACYPLCWTTNKNVNVDIKISAHDTQLTSAVKPYTQFYIKHSLTKEKSEDPKWATISRKERTDWLVIAFKSCNHYFNYIQDENKFNDI
jgi:hypothetical protein